MFISYGLVIAISVHIHKLLDYTTLVPLPWNVITYFLNDSIGGGSTVAVGVSSTNSENCGGITPIHLTSTYTILFIMITIYVTSKPSL